jgi:hypothetical protein
MSTSGETTGAPPIPPELLAQMPPDRRAKFEAAIAASRARASAPYTLKRCITPDNLQRGLDVDDKYSNDRCKPTVVSSTASVMDMRVQCAGPKQNVSGTFHFEAAKPEAVTGTINMTISVGGNVMTMKRVIQGKWLGADCGDVKESGK